MSLQPSRATGQSDGLYTVLLVISALALLLGYILVAVDLYTAHKVLSLIWPFKLS